jgi:subtilisin family serine protease
MSRRSSGWIGLQLLCGVLLALAVVPPQGAALVPALAAPVALAQDDDDDDGAAVDDDDDDGATVEQDDDDENDGAPEARFVPGEVVIKLFNASDLGAVAAAYNLDPTALDQFGSRPIYRMLVLDGTPPLEKAEQLLADPLLRVEFAEPNYIEEIPENVGRKRWAGGGGDPAPYANLWAVERIGLRAAHARTRGAGVTIAVLDTGVDATHPALAGRLLPGYDFVDDDPIPEEAGSFEQNLGFGHGTHVAGILALVAPEAQILPLRVLDADGVGNIWVLSEALAYAIDPNGDGNRSDAADIINLSLATYRDTQLLSTILPEVTCRSGDDDDDDDEAAVACAPNATDAFKGAVVVAAAGNDHNGDPATPARVVYPANEPGVIGVAAIDETDRKAVFSNYNNSSDGPVDLSAPGVGIVSSVPGGTYGSWEGTSMATPFIAGAAALLRATAPDESATQLAERLRSYVVDINALNPAYSGKLGSGRLDLRRFGRSTSELSGLFIPLIHY